MSSQHPSRQSDPDLSTRIIYMALFALVFWVLSWAVALTAIGQLLVRATSGEPSGDLARLGAGLAAYMRQIIQFLTFVSEVVPYPFTAWPYADPRDAQGAPGSAPG
jgi:hypothetical protein